VSYKRNLALLLIVGVVSVIFIGGSVCQGEEPLKIGVIQPLTGPCSLEGKLTVNGIKMAVEEINAENGLLGNPIELCIKDGKAIPSESVSAAETLIIRDKVSAIIGAWASSATLAIIPICEKYGVPLLVETSAHPKITKPVKRWVFRTKSTAELDAKALQEYFIELGFSKPAFLSVNNDWGRSVAKAYADAIEERGGSVELDEYYLSGETDFYSILTKIESSDANSLIITADVNAISVILEQSLELGMKLKKMTTSGFSPALILELAGAEAAEGLYCVDYFPYYDPPPELTEKIETFVKRYQERFPGEVLQSNVIFGYVPTCVLAKAVKKAGSVDSAKIRDALEKITYDGLMGHLEFNEEDHQAYPYVFLSRVKEEKPTLVRTLHTKP